MVAGAGGSIVTDAGLALAGVTAVGQGPVEEELGNWTREPSSPLLGSS